jgi:peptidoglycan/xylan/chitin deacetylase (PgdA/CDA1 family)
MRVERIRRIERPMRCVYLTIDDGPSSRAWQLLDYLNERHTGAVLFCEGKNLIKRPDVAARAIHEGFIIGNHSYDHPDFNKLDQAHARRQIERTDRIINELYAEVGVRRPAKYFRFPYGNAGHTKEARESNQGILHEFGYFAPLHAPDLDWGWDVDVGDWHISKQNRTRKLSAAKKKLNGLSSNAVLDLHDQEHNLRMHVFQEICEAVTNLGYAFYDNRRFHEQAAHLRRSSGHLRPLLT